MKHTSPLSLIGLVMLLFCLSSFNASAPVTSDGFFRGIRLAGRVQVVSSHEDFRVRVVSSHEDLRVRQVEHTGSSSSFAVGEWRFVDSHPDFTIRIVEDHPDFTIRYVDSHPGVNYYVMQYNI